MPSEHCGGFLSLWSSGELQLGSCGYSLRPSPSLSMPSEHSGLSLLSKKGHVTRIPCMHSGRNSGGTRSHLSVAIGNALPIKQPWSARSTSPSPSLSTPSEHCEGCHSSVS